MIDKKTTKDLRLKKHESAAPWYEARGIQSLTCQKTDVASRMIYQVLAWNYERDTVYTNVSVISDGWLQW